MKKSLNIVAVFPEIDLIQDADLRQKTINVWNRLYDEGHWEDIMALPCSTHKTDYPHVIHNRSVVQMALKVADVLEEFHNVKVNRDYLISAALLQDASKLVEYEPAPEGGCQLTELGKRFMHSLYGGHIALDEGIPYEIVQTIITHSPDSPTFPQTLITKILFYVDQTDMAAIGGDRWKKTSYIYR